MKAFLLALAALFALAPAGANAAERVPLILISIDGFRADYLDRGLTPRLAALRAKGAHGVMKPSFPTKTFPNHFTLVTGLRPDRHGIVGNAMIDPRRPDQRFSLGDPKQSLDPFWWGEAEPIWITAEAAGVRSATMFWPGSELAYHDRRPRDWLRFDGNVSDVQRVATVLDWMRRPAAIRPQLVTLYFDEVDHDGHEYGPDSAQLNAALKQVDTRIGELVDGLKALNRKANLVIVADHGMAAVNESRIIQLDTLIDRQSYVAVEAGPYAAIEPAAATDERVFDAFLKPHAHMECHRREALPAHLHYGKNPRVAAIICLAEPGWMIQSGPVKGKFVAGMHGWDQEMPEMAALFLGWGPAFTRRELGGFDNVDVYPLLARLLGITPLANDGDPKLAARALAR